MGSSRTGQDWGTGVSGQRLGGATTVASALPTDGQSPRSMQRQRAIEAAEKRAASAPGVSQQKIAETREKQQKDELIGRITEHYQRRSREVPMGLGMASVEQLRAHWDAVRTD